jgi:hypothetical protein
MGSKTFKFRAEANFIAAKKDLENSSLRRFIWKIHLYEEFLFIVHYKYPNNLYLSKIS